ncbi:helix-turn-helix domain-containing protein [Vibrio comitans]|uniref:AraC family transcriptional regulator n=1 Tax=Vibrio comitans NBRC 102076 TaxID=1219078 RepID=A0A4Y3INV9_9VIBR|nr:helix-turn-helix domain-containing protein [Vibrio comitans]GEA61193.1 AraC family transcriptional regulator [Vibrio comitans NBRC 102076]
MSKHIAIDSIAQLHRNLGLGKPLHPLISVFKQSELHVTAEVGTEVDLNLYIIALKDCANCQFGYGHNIYDFEEGMLAFMAPGQTFRVDKMELSADDVGWSIAFHPRLLKGMDLALTISRFSFFQYDISEALHCSQREIDILGEIATNIASETHQNMDRHTKKVLNANLELLLSYCTRFYDRQFMLRSPQNRELIDRFDAFLNQYYNDGTMLEYGIPSVQICGKELGLSPYYLSDLLKQETGKSALDHIHLFLIDRAKRQMLGTKDSITKIASDLGFEYPQHFSKLFKAKMGISPRQYRTTH